MSQGSAPKPPSREDQAAAHPPLHLETPEDRRAALAVVGGPGARWLERDEMRDLLRRLSQKAG